MIKFPAWRPIILGLMTRARDRYAPLHSLSPHTHMILDYFPYVKSTYFSLSIFNDFRAFRASWRRYFTQVRERRHAVANLRQIQKIIRALSGSEEIRALASTYRYFSSPQAERLAPEALAAVSVSFMREVDRLNLESQSWAEAEAFTRSQTYFNLVRDLSQSLTELEKRQLAERSRRRGVELPLELNAKVMHYELRMLDELRKWLDQKGVKSSHTERLTELISERSDSLDLTMANTAPRNSYTFFTTILGLGVGIMGLDAALATEAFGPTAESSTFTSLKQFFAENTETLYYTMGASIVGGLAGMVWEQVQYMKRLWNYNWKSRAVYRHLDDMLKIFTRWRRLGSVSELTCEDLVT